MTDNPMTDAFDEAADDQADESSEDDFDMDRYLDRINSDEVPKEKTVGMAVSEEMHAFYHELQDADEVDIDPTQSIRDHLEKLAHRHNDVFEKAMRKLEIEREF